MIPAGLFFNQLGIQQLTAVIIEAGDEIPLVSGIGSRETTCDARNRAG